MESLKIEKDQEAFIFMFVGGDEYQGKHWEDFGLAFSKEAALAVQNDKKLMLGEFAASNF